MLSIFRALSATWPARLFFLALAGVFVIWGVANRNPFSGGGNTAATVAGTEITLPQLQQSYRQALQQTQRRMGGKAELPLALRQQVAMQSMEQLVTRAALQAQVRRLGLVVPDQAISAAAHAIPAFQDASGAYDPALMRRWAQENGFTEQGVVGLLRDDLAQRQMLEAVSAGAAAPSAVVDAIFALQHERRTAAVVTFPFADAGAPAAPDEAQLKRWYANHPQHYTSPEYRRIRAVILDPAAIEAEVPVSDQDLRAAYEKQKADFVQPERRTVQVVTAPNQGAAARLAAAWRTGADWQAIQAQAQAAGGTATELDAATRAEFPGAELAEAAFGTASGSVSQPVASGLGGFFVVRVVQVDAGGSKSFEQVRDQLRGPLAADRAADLLDQRATQLDQDLQSGRTLDDQLAGAPIAEQGTLDARGMTPGGMPAPLRGTPALRAALIAAAFQARPGDPLRLERVAADAPRGLPSYYAVQVQTILPPAVRPYDQVADQVRADWMADQRRHAQDAAATRLMLAVQAGTPIAAAARADGLTSRMLPPVTRAGGVDAVPEKLAPVLFGLRKGEATMIETPDGFVVAQLAAIDDPSAKDDTLGMARLRAAIDGSVGNDMQASFVVAARNRARPQINAGAVQQLVQAGE